jgi:hypothetical protein
MPTITIQRVEGTPVETWVMLELQGTVEARSGTGATSEDVLEIGQLTLEKGGTMPVLIVGLSRLEGSVVKLPNPLLVIKKRPSSSSSSVGASYDVLGVVREKYLFKTRPKTL